VVCPPVLTQYMKTCHKSNVRILRCDEGLMLRKEHDTLMSSKVEAAPRKHKKHNKVKLAQVVGDAQAAVLNERSRIESADTARDRSSLVTQSLEQRRTREQAEQPINGGPLQEGSPPLIKRLAPANSHAFQAKDAAERQEQLPGKHGQEPVKEAGAEGKRAEPVLPWMRRPVRIEAGQGVPLSDVRGMDARLRGCLEACKGPSTIAPVELSWKACDGHLCLLRQQAEQVALWSCSRCRRLPGMSRLGGTARSMTCASAPPPAQARRWHMRCPSCRACQGEIRPTGIHGHHSCMSAC
jgi:hypothetical protein